MDNQKNKNYVSTNTFESITRIDFSIYSNADVIKDSVINDPNGITVAEIYNNGEPVSGGVIDKRLGVIDRSECGTCGETAMKCVGHFGHIKFVEPVFHLGFMTFLKNILSCICIRCNKLLVYRNEAEISKMLRNKHGKQRFNEIRNICKNITHCQKDNYGCGTPAHKITIEKKNGDVFILAEPSKKTTENDEYGGESKKKSRLYLTPQLCYDILKAVSNEDFITMGFDPTKSRPEDMVIINFPVSPIQVRPSIKLELMGSSPMVDDLTNKLLDIIKTNESLKYNKGDGSLTKNNKTSDDFTLLQLHVATFFANDTLGLPRSQQKNKTITKSLSERLKGKEGRIRGNLMGKRVDMSARTVITSDPNIALNEVGVPLLIAKNLTYPEVVTKENIKYLSQLVKNGRRNYPGANFVIKNYVDKDGVEVKHIFNLRYVDKPIHLEYGNIVKRHLINGDMAIFNRQPSLHKLSMMGHRIHVIPDDEIKTFRVNVSVTDPYNADFDGDEMNLHIPQSVQTTTEVILIMNADKRFMSPASSKVAINAKQDTVMGTYVMTLDDTKIDWKDAMNFLMTSTVGINSKIPKNKLVSGKYLFSEIIPDGLNIARKNEDGSYNLRIINGELVAGELGKSDIGAVLQKMWFEYGSEITRKYIDDLQRLVLQFLMKNGFTVGIKDAIVSKKANRSVYKIIETNRKKILGAITEYENDPNVVTPDAFESHLRERLGSVLSDVQKVVMNSFDTDSGIYITIKSGSNGTDMNAGQIIGCIGQVLVEEKRIQKKFNGRTLPTFAKHDNSSFARGFCYNSFIGGLNPMEFFFHVMAGREGLINTAIKTASTGYIQRKLIKFMEDLKVEYDGTVRNANDKMIQCVYGDNGINTENQIDQKIQLMRANNETVRNNFTYSDTELTKMKKQNPDTKYDKKINEKVYNKLITLRDQMRAIQKLVNVSQINFRENYKMPVDINQQIINIVNKESRNTDDIVDPYYVLKNIREMYTGTHSRIMKLHKNSVIKKRDDETVKLLLKIYLYDVLCPKKCTSVYKLSTKEFDELVLYFHETILLAKVEGGEMVGFIGSQSIGEPVTQSNLKSFHKSGTLVNVSGGLVRVQELLAISKEISTPITEIILEDSYKNDKIVANKIASHLNYITLQHVMDDVQIVYDPDPLSSKSVMSKDEATNIFENKESKSGCYSDVSNLPWALKIILSKEKMIDYNLTMLDIKASFCHNWEMRFEDSKGSKKEFKKIIEKITQTAISSTFDNTPTQIIHIRFDSNNVNTNVFIQFMDMVITKYRIKGIQGINKSNNVKETKYIDFDEKGDVVTKSQYVIYAEGINLQEIAQINGIDLLNSRCNHVVTIYETYGIEAARAAFIREFTVAIESSGGFSNYQHVALLADAVTHTGGLIAVNRHGANKLDTDPISRASFEQTVEQLLAAAVFGESDHIRSVSSRIMVGSLINGGTGAYDLLLDHELVCQTLVPKEERETGISITKKKSALDNIIKKKK